MRTYTFTMPCGHTIRSISKAALSKPCVDCYLASKEPSPNEQDYFDPSVGAVVGFPVTKKDKA